MAGNGRDGDERIVPGDRLCVYELISGSVLIFHALSHDEPAAHFRDGAFLRCTQVPT